MVFVYIEAEGTESSIHTVQAIHIAFALVTTGMNLALTEETCLQKWTEPRWPLPAIFTSKFTLFQINKTQNSITIMNKSNYTYTHIHILDKPWFLGINGLEEIKKKRTNREKKEDGGGEVSSVLYWSGWGEMGCAYLTKKVHNRTCLRTQTNNSRNWSIYFSFMVTQL